MRVHINGHGWIDLPDWPPAMPEQVLYLQPAGRLADTEPDATAPPSVFTYNPADPTPTVGGRLLSPEGGYRNDTRLAQRADVLSFTGDPLPADLYVVGTPVIELSHSSDNPYNDVFVRVSEVDAKGRSVNVTDGFRGSQPIPGWSASSSTRSRTGSPPDPVSVSSSPAGLIRGSRAIWAPTNHPSPVDGLCRPPTPCTTATAGSPGCVLPAGPRPPSAD